MPAVRGADPVTRSAPDWIALLEELCQMGADRPLAELLATIVDNTVAALGAEAGSLGLWEPESGQIVIRAHAGRRPPSPEARFCPGEGVAGWVAGTRQAALIADADQDERYAHLDYPRTRSVLSVPLVRADELIGVLTVTSARTDAFHDDDLRVLRLFAAQATSQLDVARRAACDADDRGRVLLELIHDLRSPLSSIRGFLTLLAHENGSPLTATQRDLLHHSQLAVERLQSALERLTDRETDAADDELTAVQPTSLGEVVDAVVARLHGVAASGGIRIESRVSTELPRVVADPFQIARVIENLLDNAVRYSRPDGHVWIEAEATDGWVRCSVQDAGIGIPAWALERIFERQYRVPSSRAVHDGMGQGLAICRRIVQQHGGHIWVESVEGRGASFHFTLPAAGARS